MGNRAVVIFKPDDLGIYLHWNGGRDSVEAFLAYCEMRGFREGSYGVARFCQVVGNYFGGDLSIGIENVSGKSYSELDPGDNGVYVVLDWHIAARFHVPEKGEQKVHDLASLMIDVDSCQPEDDRLGEEKIRTWVKENGRSA